MHTILVSILIFLYLVNEKFQIQATVPLAGTQSFRCGDIPELIVSPESDSFWELNQTNFEIRLSIIPQDCIYRYVVTSIGIRLPDQQSVNLDEYYIKYRLDNTNRLMKLRELATPPVNVGDDMKVEISPLMLEELSIIRLPTNTCARVFRVRYEIRGFTTRRAAVLSYLIAQPNCRDDDTYPEASNGEVCYGGRGQLIGTGNPEGDGGTQMTVGWRCNETTINCSYPLRILLTGQVNVSRIMIYGLNSNLIMRAVPEIIIIQPNIRTNSISNEFHPDSYPIEIPINRKTDEIFIYMVLPAIRILSISKVEVFSNGDNLALFQIDIESFGTTTSISEDSKSKVSLITLGSILGIIIASLLIILVLVSSCCIYLLIEMEKLKRMTPSRKFIYVNTNQGNELLRLQEKYPYPINGDKTGTSTINTTTQLPHESGMYEEIDFSRVKERGTDSVEIEKRAEKNQATHTYYNTLESAQNVATTNPFVESINDLLPTTEIAIAEYEEMIVKDSENKVQ